MTLRNISLMLAMSVGLSAAPVTVTPSGAFTLIPGGYFFNLMNQYDGYTQTVTLTLSQPVGTFRAFIDNAPFDWGSGVCIQLDGISIGCVGEGYIFQDYVVSTPSSPFSTILLTTNQPRIGSRERGNIFLDLPEDRSTPTVPEPGSLVLLTVGLVSMAIWGRGKCRSSKLPQ